MSLKGIRYHDYLLMVAALDTEWTRSPQKAKEAGANGFAGFQKTCDDYRDGVIRKQKDWMALTQPRHEPEIEPFLFQSQGWIPCGHPDALCLALVDDLDAVQTVVETYPKTVEELTIAFCPQVSQFTGKLDHKDRELFIEPHEAFQPNQEFAKSYPLLFFARLKMQGLLTIGRALPILEVAYHEFTGRIVEAVQVLRKVKGTSLLGDPDPRESMRICLLDLQEEEEVGVLFFTTNLSLPMAVLSHLQSLTVGQMLKAERWSAVRTHLDHTDHYDQLLKYAKAIDAAQGDSLLEAVADSHVLRWTRSTAAFSNALTADSPMLEHVSGWCETHIAVNHPPGHQHDLECLVHQITSPISPLNADEVKARPTQCPPAETYRLHVAGTTDYFVPLAEAWRKPIAGTGASPYNPIHSSGRLVPTRDLIRVALHLPEALKPTTKQQGFNGRHLSGWSTTVTVPVPIVSTQGTSDFFHPAVRDGHNALIKSILEDLRQHVFQTQWKDDTDDPLKSYPDSVPDWKICLTELRTKTRMAGLPFETRRTLIVLFENFAAILASPLSFDIVLDLYDVMAALYLKLVDLPRGWETEDASHHEHPAGYTRRMEDKYVDGLNSLLESIDAALELRQRRLYPENRIRDWALDYRSNILQIILSAEAALKCAVGIHRKFVLGNEDIQADFGVIHQVTFSSNIIVSRNAYGDGMAGSERRRLAQFKSGVSHLTHLTGFSDFFHETFHLVFDETLSASIHGSIKKLFSGPIIEHHHLGLPDSRELLPDRIDATYERVTETFVHLCCSLFIYDDWKLALKSHAASYSTNVRSATSNVDEKGVLNHNALVRFATHFAPAFIAALVVQKAKASANALWWTAKLGAEDWYTLDEAEVFFEEALEVVRPWLADYDWIFRKNQPEHDACKKWFISSLQRGYLDTHAHLAELWYGARKTYRAFVHYVANERLGNPVQAPNSPPERLSAECVQEFQLAVNEIDRQLVSGIDREAATYKPVIGAKIDSQGACHDAALLACRCLRYHWRYLLEEQEGDGVRFLRRSIAKKGNVAWPAPDDIENKPARMLMDRTSATFFCCSASDRRHRTGIRIVMFKTFWDIASRNRGRRLRTLMKQALAIKDRKNPPKPTNPESN